MLVYNVDAQTIVFRDHNLSCCSLVVVPILCKWFPGHQFSVLGRIQGRVFQILT